MEEKIQLGIAWYSEEEWDDWILSVPDADTFEDTFKEWETLAEKKYQELKMEGYSVRKVPIELQKFLQWCLTHVRPPDASSRTEYVCEIQRSRDLE